MRTILALLALSTLVGCASFDRGAPPPEAKQPMTVSVSREPPSAMSELPLGVYRIPESLTYVSGHQRGQGAGMMFGLLGAAITHGVNESRAKEMMAQAESALRSDFAAQAAALAAAKIREHGVQDRFSVGEAAKGTPTLTLTPYVVLSYITDETSRPYVILKASVKDAAGTETWWSRYVSTVNENRPLAGDNGWSTNNGAAFNAAVSRALGNAVDLAVRDIGGKLNRASARDVKLKTQYAFVRQDLELIGKLVESGERTVAFIPKVGDVVVFAGVNIFDKELVQIGDAPAEKQ